jgi:pimeloyl-ACP methyl ester carboxylesterase
MLKCLYLQPSRSRKPTYVGGVTVPYASNDGIRIHYQVTGEGPPLVLVHGLTTNLKTWGYYGYVQALQDDYRLIQIDARGHGESDKPHDPEGYRTELRVGDVVAVLDDLGIPKAHYFGSSMGGEIGWGIAKYAPERFHSLIIGGAHPGEEDRDSRHRYIQLFKQGIDALVAMYKRVAGSGWAPKWEAMARANDLDALIALESWGLRDLADYDEILATITVRCLIIVGETDEAYSKARECATHLPNATLAVLPGLGHKILDQIDIVLPHVTTFLESVAEHQ